MVIAPALSPIQRRAAEAAHEAVPANCVVTGGNGFVGSRLVEMLVERGAKRVVSFDIIPRPAGSWEHASIVHVQGDLRNPAEVSDAIQGADCVWHLGAAVGPFHPAELYEAVNVAGTRHVVAACLAHGVPKIVMSSSPSTRMNGSDLDGVSELELPSIPQRRYLQDYAKTKAEGEKFVTDACCDDLMTIAVAPHQVYGPRDTLFMPNILETAATGKLRIFGRGRNRVCFTHVDNYCHGLILGERALYRGSPALGQFYICTDASTHRYPEGYCYFWDELDDAITSLGLPSISKKFHLPRLFMFFLGYLCNIIGWLLGMKLKLSPFTVRMLTMHRWFRFERAAQDLKYEPIVPFTDGWIDMIQWFKSEWLASNLTRSEGSSYGRIYGGSQQKIDFQTKKKAI
eukprot:TRINITY_DN6111_c0_g2_i1.p1 TRINITY_DN6111_c0_g2~~TRINITY_DN6111_c0_g2_i1.p1  ORF type:complete len:400 (+),score=59.42 TRINITY_DN6111_c0_g2_i1:140-1339(+)